MATTINFEGISTFEQQSIVVGEYQFSASSSLILYGLESDYSSNVIHTPNHGAQITLSRVDGQSFNLASFKHGVDRYGQPNSATITGTRVTGDPLADSFSSSGSQSELSVKTLNGWTNLTQVVIHYSFDSYGGLDDFVLEAYSLPTFAIAATTATQAEGNTDTKDFTFTVTRSGDTSGSNDINWAVTGSGANPANAPDFGGTLPSGTLSFGAEEITKTITVNVQGDSTIEADETFTVTLSDPTNGATLTTATATGTITNDDTAGFTLSKPTATVSEAGTTDSFTVVLNAQPSSDVVLSVISNNSDEATVAPTTLTFTPTNWNAAQTVTLTGVNDLLADGNQTSTVTVSVVGGQSDDAFDLLPDQGVSVTTTDNDTAGFTLSKATATVSEAGTTDSFTVVLNTQPSSNVVLSVTRSDASEASVAPTTLTFTSDNWNTAQTVTLTGVNDLLADGNQTSTVTVSVVGGQSDDAFDLLPDQGVTVTTTDNDTAGFTLSKATATVSESGSSDSFTVVLNTQPSSNVVLSVSRSDASEVSVAPTTLTFTPDNWNTAQTVTVTGVDDAGVDGNQTSTVTVSVVDGQSDDAFDLLPDQSVTVTTTDNDTAPVNPNPVNPNPVNPNPVNPNPVNPSPVNPNPVNPSPVNPSPVNPSPVIPQAPGLGLTGQNLLQLNNTAIDKTAKFSVVQPSTVGEIEVGYFKVDDAQGNLGTLAPGSVGYLEAAKAVGNYKTIFSTLGDGDIALTELSRMLTLAPGQFYSFFVVQGATADGLLQGDLSSSLGALTFGSPFLNQGGAQPLSFSFLQSQGAYELAWDLDQDGQFDDFTFRVEISDGAPPLGAGLQGGQESEVLDLRELAGQTVNLQLTIRSEAFNTNVLGFYRVDNAQGTITDSFGNVFNPGDAGYLQAAAAQWAGQGSVSTSAGRSFSTTVAVEGGGIWVPFMITNGTLEQLLDSDTSNDPIVFTPFLGSNPGQGDYVRLLGDNTFGFEDMVGGDFDYDDLVVKISVTPVS